MEAQVEVAQTGTTPVAQVAEVSPPIQAPVATNATEEAKPKQDDRLSAKFALLARKEKEIQKRAQELKEKEGKISKYETVEQEYKTNPMKLLETYGLSFKDLVDFNLNNQQLTAEQRVNLLEQKLTQAEKAKEEEKLRQLEEEKTQAEEYERGAISTYKQAVKRLAQEAKSEFELSYDSEELEDFVYEIVEAHWKQYGQQSGKALEMKEAVGEFEKLYEEKLRSMLAKPKAQKIAKEVLGISDQPKVEEKLDLFKPAPKEPSAPKTLTNSAQTTVPTPSIHQPKSVEESMEQAARLIKWV